jgi:hypothetical protein
LILPLAHQTVVGLQLGPAQRPATSSGLSVVVRVLRFKG